MWDAEISTEISSGKFLHIFFFGRLRGGPYPKEVGLGLTIDLWITLYNPGVYGLTFFPTTARSRFLRPWPFTSKFFSSLMLTRSFAALYSRIGYDKATRLFPAVECFTRIVFYGDNHTQEEEYEWSCVKLRRTFCFRPFSFVPCSIQAAFSKMEPSFVCISCGRKQLSSFDYFRLFSTRTFLKTSTVRVWEQTFIFFMLQ